MNYSIYISRDASFIYIKYCGLFNINKSQRILEKIFEIGKKININRYLFDATGLKNNDSFINKCDYFYNTVFYLANITIAEKIAFLINNEDCSHHLIIKLSSFYLNNFSTFLSKKSAVAYLVQDRKKNAMDICSFPFSAVPKHSRISLKLNGIKLKCNLCRNSVFKYNSEILHNPFQCSKCGAEYSVNDFSRKKEDKIGFHIID